LEMRASSMFSKARPFTLALPSAKSSYCDDGSALPTSAILFRHNRIPVTFVPSRSGFLGGVLAVTLSRARLADVRHSLRLLPSFIPARPTPCFERDRSFNFLLLAVGCRIPEAPTPSMSFPIRGVYAF